MSVERWGVGGWGIKMERRTDEGKKIMTRAEIDEGDKGREAQIRLERVKLGWEEKKRERE